MILDAHGVRLELPVRWSGRLFARAGVAVLHAGDYRIALEDRSTFGDQSTARMPAHATFVALVEYLPGSGLTPGRGLFAAKRVELDPTRFSERGLAHPRPDQQGAQHFFTAAGRPFCLYLVLAGGRAVRRHQLATVDHLLRSLSIAPRRVRDSRA
ncbi:MAG TPA: hypothetical protein VG410_01910 [Solirubrobacteraceae bacterium]|nr:hypothetical protein [Solirubrobacteraceae bacterium]